MEIVSHTWVGMMIGDMVGVEDIKVNEVIV